jgi:peroxiredoxin Q/BCP
MHRWICPLAALAVVSFFGTAIAADAPPKEGSPAPDIDLPATQIEKVAPGGKDAKTLKLSDLKGKKNVVLYFYPKAMTPGCTVESCGFRDLAEKLAALDTVVIGISVDKLEDQQKFTDKEKLTFPLIADSDKAATKAYGALGPRGVAARYTFVIDKQGVIRKVYTKVTPATHPEEVLTFVKENLAKN